MQKTSSCSLFLIALFVFSSTSTAFFVERKANTVAAAAAKQLLELSTFKNKYVIDDVLTLIKNLVDAAQKELDEFNANWGSSGSEKNSSLQAIKFSLETQGATCETLQEKINSLNETLNDLRERMEDYNQSIKANEDKIASLLSTRCDANKNYVLSLKNNKMTLSLVAVLKEAVQQFNETLLQRHVFEEIHGKLLSFIERYGRKQRKNIVLAEQEVPDVQERTGNLGDKARGWVILFRMSIYFTFSGYLFRLPFPLFHSLSRL